MKLTKNVLVCLSTLPTITSGLVENNKQLKITSVLCPIVKLESVGLGGRVRYCSPGILQSANAECN